MEMTIQLNQYNLLMKIAQGGMAEIFLAENTQEKNQKVAIKKLLKEFSYDKVLIALLRSEHETLTHLNHPNIISASEFVSKGEDHFIVLEWIDGFSLREILDRCDIRGIVLPPPVAVAITLQLVMALTYLHAATDSRDIPLQLLHTDLNPKNILIGKNGQVKLIDFSLGQAQENRLGARAGLGRAVLAYMSPEQAKNEALDERSEVFSVGTLLYEMLSGKPPFLGKNKFEIYSNLISKEIIPALLPETLGLKLKQIVCHALEKQPANRFRNMEEMEKNLRTFEKTPSNFSPEETVLAFLNSPGFPNEEIR